MSDDEIKLITSLAGDKSWSPNWPDDPYDTKQALERLDPAHVLESIGAEPAPIYFLIEDITMFLRHFCYWEDLCPRYNELRHWLPILSQKHIRLCELTPQAWAHIIETETVRKLTQ